MSLNEIERGQLCKATIQCYHELGGTLADFPSLLKKIIEEKAWEKRVTHNRTIELGSLRELITEQPIRGWGEDPDKIEALLAGDPVLFAYREAMNGVLGEHPGRPANDSDNVRGTNINSRACTNDYWQARIARDCPEEIQALKAGMKSIIEIRREHGWVSKSKRVTLTGDVEIDRQRLLDAWGEEYLSGLGS